MKVRTPIEPKDQRCESISTLLNRFYQEHDLGEDGGASQRWAKVKMGRFHFYIPNTSSRKRALFFHDVHHLATGYQTDLRSEAEISAWEIASGCRDFVAAWILDYFGFVLGLFISPRRTFRAFVRGRNCKNLYHGTIDSDTIKNSTVEEIRSVLGLNLPPQPWRITDLLLLGLWSLPVAIVVLMTVGLLTWSLVGF